MTSLSRSSPSKANIYLSSARNKLPLHPSHRRQPSTPANSAIDFRQWDPDNPPKSVGSLPTSALPVSLSPIARYVLDSFRRNNNRWCEDVLSDLSKLRRVTPYLITEILRSSSHLSLPVTKLFYWAGKQKGYSHTYASYNALAYYLNYRGNFRAADHVVELMQSQGKPPTEKQFEILIRFHTDAGRGKMIFLIYEKMRKKFGIKPRVFLYNRIMDGLFKTGNLDLGLRVYKNFREDGLKEESVTFMILTKALCKEGRIDEVFEVLSRMKTECCKPDVFAYTAMVKVLIGEGYLDGCLKIWKEMKADGVLPDAMAYTTLIVGLCGCGRVGEGCEMFRDMKRNGYLVDRAVYGALVDGFVKTGKVGKGCEVLNEMLKDGYRADLRIYDSLITGLSDVGRVDKADKLFLVLVQDCLVPGFATVHPMLMAYVRTGEMESLIALVKKMDKLGLPVMNHLVKFFSVLVADGEQVLNALEVFELLKERGYSCVSIYNVIIECLHKNRKVERALSLFKEMNNSQDFKPDSSTYSLIIACLVDKGEIKEACACYITVKEKSWIPSIAAYCSLVKGLCKIGQINAAITLVRDCLGNVENGPLEFKYALSVLHASKSGGADAVLRILNEMIEEQGHPLEDIIYSCVIHGFCKYSNPEEAKKVFEDVKKRGLLSESRFIMYEDMLREHFTRVTAGLVHSALKFFDLESKFKLTSK